MNKQPKITDATKKAFIDAFIRLSEDKPIEKITVKELTVIAGYNRTTFYNYFTDIYSLYEYLEEYVYIQIRDNLKNNMLNLGSDSDIFLNVFANIYTNMNDYFKVVLCTPYPRNFTERVKELLIDYCFEKLTLPSDDISLVYRMDYHLSAMISLAIRQMKNPNEMSPKQLAELIQDILINGVLNGIVAHP